MNWDINLLTEKLYVLFDKLIEKDYSDEFEMFDSIGMLVLMIESVDENKLPFDFDKNRFLNIKEKLKKIDIFDYEDENNNYELEFLKSKKEFIKYFSSLKMEPEIKPVKINMSKDDFINLFESFLKYLDSDFYKYYLILKNNKRINLVSNNEWKKNYIGQFYQVNFLKEGYISVPFLEYINYFSGLSHEFGHAYNAMCSNYSESNFEMFYYAEIISILFEFLFRKYLLDNNVISNKEYYESEMMVIFYNIERSNKMMDLLLVDEFSNSSKKSNKIYEDLINAGYNFTFEYINELLESDLPRQTLYISNYVMALKIFDVILLNKEKGLKLLKEVSKAKNKEDLIKLDLMETTKDIELLNRYYNSIKNGIYRGEYQNEK